MDPVLVWNSIPSVGTRTVEHPAVAQQLAIGPDQVFQVFPDRHNSEGLVRTLNGPAHMFTTADGRERIKRMNRIAGLAAH